MHPHTSDTRSSAGATSMLALLVGAAALAYQLSTLPTTAPTFDEVAHLGSGVARALRGVQHYNLEHPPLVKWLAGVPLSVMLQVPPEEQWPSNQWALGQAVLTGWGLTGQEAILLGRLPLLPMFLGLLAGVYRVSLRAWGPREGLLALVLVAACPIMLGHARLVTTDVPLATFSFLTFGLSWRYCRRPTVLLALLLGVGVGAMLATKYTAVVLLPALVVGMVWARGSETWRGSRAWLELGIICLAAVCTLQVAFGGQPFWQGWMDGFSQVGFNHTEGYAFYRGGEFSESGFPDYFLYALALKSGWGVLLLLLVSPLCFRVAYPLKQLGHSVWPFLVLPALSYLAAVLLLAPDIGVRYLIPALPFVYVGLARGCVVLAEQTRYGGRLLPLVVVLQLGSAGLAWPDPLSFFNGVGGCFGPRASRCLDDSNLDWGQDLGRIGPVLMEKGILEAFDEPVRLFYFGSAPPRAWLPGAVRAEPAEFREPLPALYAMSIQRLIRLRNEPDYREEQDWLKRFRPILWIGNTYAVFDFRVKIGRNKAS